MLSIYYKLNCVKAKERKECLKIMNRKTFIIITSTIAVVFIFAAGLFLVIKNNSSYKKIKLGDVVLKAEIALSTGEKQKGLSGRDYMKENNGMLFIFPQSGLYPFWMKDMKFPIDIIWLDDELKIIGLEKNINPNTLPEKFFPPSLAKFVLEVNGGWSDENKIKEGMTARVLNK